MNSHEKSRKPMDEDFQVYVRAFASLRQALGTARMTLSLPPGTTVADLIERLSGDFPAAAPHLARALVTVNQDYVDRTRSLAPDDEVAVFPPVSGGATDAVYAGAAMTYAALSSEPIDPHQLSARVSEPGVGAVVTFAGVVRDNNLGRQVRYLEYDAYPEMAETKMRQVVHEARERWPGIRGVALVHRTGHLEIGEMAVLVAIGAPHRDDGAFEAARYIIDRIKEIVPIWKKEGWSDGAEWLEGDYHPRSGE